ncbi:MAG: hypothetical protein C4332_04945 [Meiothermus sp.]
MSRAALSVLIFGLYMLIEGATLLVAPNVLFALLGLPPSQEVWPRAAGWALMALGFYYLQNARANYRPFLEWTVWVRSAQFLVFIGLVLFAGGKPVLLFSGVEFLAGLWTGYELRRSPRV